MKMILYGILFILVGILIIIFPALLAYFVAGIIIFIGINLLIIWIALNKAKKSSVNNSVVFEVWSFKILKK